MAKDSKEAKSFLTGLRDKVPGGSIFNRLEEKGQPTGATKEFMDHRKVTHAAAQDKASVGFAVLLGMIPSAIGKIAGVPGIAEGCKGLTDPIAKLLAKALTSDNIVTNGPKYGMEKWINGSPDPLTIKLRDGLVSLSKSSGIDLISLVSLNFPDSWEEKFWDGVIKVGGSGTVQKLDVKGLASGTAAKEASVSQLTDIAKAALGKHSETPEASSDLSNIFGKVVDLIGKKNAKQADSDVGPTNKSDESPQPTGP